jgi:hypothetical protein
MELKEKNNKKSVSTDNGYTSAFFSVSIFKNIEGADVWLAYPLWAPMLKR